MGPILSPAGILYPLLCRCRVSLAVRSALPSYGHAKTRTLSPFQYCSTLQNPYLGLRNLVLGFVNRKMAAEPDAARVTRAGFKRQEQRAADAARLAYLNLRRQQRAAAGNAGVGGAAGGSSTAAGSARFESAGHTHPPRPTAFEGVRSMGPSRDIFKCAVLSRGPAVAAPAAFLGCR